MITLQYGRQKPQNGNKGQIVFDALSANIDIDDAHDHNGINSAPLKSMNLERGGVEVIADDFYLDGGKYRVDIELPPGYGVNSSLMMFLVVGGDYGGRQFTPTFLQDGDEFNISVYMPFPQSFKLVCT